MLKTLSSNPSTNRSRERVRTVEKLRFLAKLKLMDGK
jgi:hypothetical protein